MGELIGHRAYGELDGVSRGGFRRTSRHDQWPSSACDRAGKSHKGAEVKVLRTRFVTVASTVVVLCLVSSIEAVRAQSISSASDAGTQRETIDQETIARGCSIFWAKKVAVAATLGPNLGKASLKFEAETRLEDAADLGSRLGAQRIVVLSQAKRVEDNARQALADWKCRVVKEDDAALFNLAIELGRALQAEARYTEAEEVLRANLAFTNAKFSGDRLHHHDALNALADATEASGEYAMAQRLRDQARAFRININPSAEERESLSHQEADINMALIVSRNDLEIGMIGVAESTLRHALEMADHRDVPDDIKTAEILLELSRIFDKEGKFVAAQELLQRFQSIPGVKVENQGKFIFDARSELVANLLSQHRASDAAAAASEMLSEAKARRDPTLLYLANVNVADSLMAMGKYEAAEPYVIAADEPVTGFQLSPEAHGALQLRLAKIFYQEGKFTKAEAIQQHWVQVGAEALRREWAHTGESGGVQAEGELPVNVFGDPKGAEFAVTASADEFVAYAENLRDLGATLLAERRYDESIRSLRRVIQINDRQVEVGSQENRELHKGGAQTSRSAASGMLAEALWGQTQALASVDAKVSEATAFTAAQIATDNSAANALARSGARIAATSKGLGDQLDKRDRLIETLNNLNRQDIKASAAGGAGGYENNVELTKQIKVVSDELSAVNDGLHNEFPSYWDLLSPKPVPLDELRDPRLLHHNEALIFFLITPGREKGLVFAVSDNGAAWANIGFSGDELLDRVTRLREEIDPAGYGLRGVQRLDSTGTPARAFERQTAYELYQGLLGDASIQAVLNQKSVLIFVPSGPLTSLPPGLLVTGPPEGGIAGDTDPRALRMTPWLLRSKAIAILPSVSSLRTLRQLSSSVNRSRQDRLLAFADPDFGGSTGPSSRGSQVPRGLAGYFRDGSPDIGALRELPALPGTREEAEALRTALKADPDSVLTGANASKSELMARNADGRLSKVGVLEFATHALVSGDVSGLGEPALVLAAGSKPEDTLLLASEAATLKLNSEWVLLSACNTASPESPQAQGLSGLSRAFFYAGAHALLVSHWRVRDDIAAKLVPAIVTQEGNDPSLGHAEAVRRASLAVLDDPTLDAASPAAWAPFTLVGEPER